MDKQKIIEILKESIKEVKPENLIKNQIKFSKNILQIKNHSINLKKIKKIYVCGSGKASYGMGVALLDILGDKLSGGVIISPVKHEKIKNIKILKGSHPIPDENSLKSTEILCNFLKKLDKDDFLIYLLSGGSSALLEMLPEDVSLDELKNLTEIMLKSGMTIEEINSLRKRISLVKGGKLLNYIKCDGICIVLSDVIGDDLRYIGSGPLFPEKDDFEPQKILEKYNIEDKIPEKIKKYFVKSHNVQKRKFPHFIIGSNLDFLKAIKKLLKEKANIEADILTTFLKGEAREVAKVIVSIGKFLKKPLIFGGETTVTVKGDGKGGRNQEIVLSALLELQYEKNFIFASIASDGIDGNTNAAGAIIDKNTIKKVNNLNLEILEYLNRNDSYNFFQQTEDLIITGITGTNVLDATFIYIF